MKKNFIQRHIIWVGLIVLCFLVIPNRWDAYGIEGNKDQITQLPAIKLHNEEAQTRSKRVVIDPGHGGYDSGSVSNNGVIEKELTLKVSKKIGKILEANQIEVIYTRSSDRVAWSDSNIDDLNERTKIANSSNADCFISIHLNFSETYGNEIAGHEIWLNYENEDNISLATQINKQLQKLSKSEDRGLKDQALSPMFLLVYNNIPSVLIETGFLSNDEEAAYLNSEQGSTEIAEAIANGVIAYIK